MPKQTIIEQQDVQPRVVDVNGAAKMLGVSKRTLNNWRYAKDGPKGPRFARIGNRVVYPIAEIDRYIEEHMV